MSKFIDMTGWIMSEHGVPESRLTVIERAEDYIDKNGQHRIMWLCECSCAAHNKIIALGKDIKNGHTKSCGCLKIDNLILYSKKINEYGFCEDGKSKWILLANTNKKAYYDIDNAKEIEEHVWHESDRGYATTSIGNAHIRMHQLIGFSGYDHIDRNQLNNRKSNLRSCTQQENSRNRSLSENNKTGITGVCWDEGKLKWRVSIGIDYKSKHIGYYLNFNDAVKARLEAEAKYFGEFAPQRHLFEQYKINVESEEIINGSVS